MTDTPTPPVDKAFVMPKLPDEYSWRAEVSSDTALRLSIVKVESSEGLTQETQVVWATIESPTRATILTEARRMAESISERARIEEWVDTITTAPTE